MKSDLDRLMQERGFDAVIVMGHADENHTLHYMTNNAKISEGIVVKRCGKQPILVCGSMEREEAAKSGLVVATYNDFDLLTLIKETGSVFEGHLKMITAIFERYGIGRTVGFYGLGDPGQSFMMLTQLAAMLPNLTITGETETTIFDEAYATKDSDELAAIKSVAERTNIVMSETVEFLKNHAVKNSRIVRPGGEPLTVGDVKRFVRGRLLDHGLEDAGGGMIFSIGRDAGVPHSRGEEDDHLELGKSIIFDLFPRDLGGGYFHDMTRTFCLGYAPPEVQEAYDHVMHVFYEAMEAVTVGEEASRYQDLACDILEQYGHKTIRSEPGTVEGYVHSLGHGLGLEIHARPRLSAVSSEAIQVGQVFSIEPGLYYPERGFGVRVEDTVYVDENGEIRSLTPFSKDLVIPVD